MPQGATNSVAHMQSVMNQILRNFVPKKTISFVDDIRIKGCQEGAKNLTIDADGCRIFVKNHITDVERILEGLEEVDLTLSINKSKFGFDEIIVVGYICERYGRKPNSEKVDAITGMTVCSSIIEVRRFLGAYVFYQFWIPHFAHMAESLYKLLRNETKIK
jgi:hypothetical protein